MDEDVAHRQDGAAYAGRADALSPQCGFSSIVHGNDIEAAQQAAKMQLAIDVATDVWGGTVA